MRSSRVVAKKRPLGMAPRQWPARPTRCMRDGDGAGVFDLADEVDVADVDAELERCGGDEELDFAVFERCSASRRSLRESEPWWAATFSGPRRSPSFEGDLFDEAACVDEDEGGAVFEREVGELVVDSSHMALVVTEPSSSEGTSMARSRWRRWPTWMMAARFAASRKRTQMDFVRSR